MEEETDPSVSETTLKTGVVSADEMPELVVKPKAASIYALLKGLVKHKASDLHVKVGRPPLYRVNGVLLPAKMPALALDEVKALAYSTMTQKQIQEFEEKLQIDFGYLVPGLARFRANVFMQKGSLAFVIRAVPLSVPELSTMGLPPVLTDLAMKPRGLLLVTGATGSGKSTTMAALIDFINRNQRCHIICIEDPIEYIFEDNMATVSQREVGVDTMNLRDALRGALRQDPDVIIIGEMRDYETMQVAVTAAETGHLVISTLHTNSAVSTIDRIIDCFPPEAKNQLRLQLASCLVGVIAQRLIRKADGSGRIVACEVLTKSPTVEKLIVENRLNELEEAMESSNVLYKMQSMNQAIAQMIRDGVITKEEGVLNSDKREDLILKMSGMVGGGQSGIDAKEIMEQLQPSEGVSRTVKIDDADTNSGIEVESKKIRWDIKTPAPAPAVATKKKPA